MGDSIVNDITRMVSKWCKNSGQTEIVDELIAEAWMWVDSKLKEDPEYDWKHKIYSYMRSYRRTYWKAYHKNVPVDNITHMADCYQQENNNHPNSNLMAPSDTIDELRDLERRISALDRKEHRDLVRLLLKDNNKTKAAKAMGVSRQTIYRWIDKIKETI